MGYHTKTLHRFLRKSTVFPSVRAHLVTMPAFFPPSGATYYVSTHSLRDVTGFPQDTPQDTRATLTCSGASQAEKEEHVCVDVPVGEATLRTHSSFEVLANELDATGEEMLSCSML